MWQIFITGKFCLALTLLRDVLLFSVVLIPYTVKYNQLGHKVHWGLLDCFVWPVILPLLRGIGACFCSAFQCFFFWKGGGGGGGEGGLLFFGGGVLFRVFFLAFLSVCLFVVVFLHLLTCACGVVHCGSSRCGSCGSLSSCPVKDVAAVLSPGAEVCFEGTVIGWLWHCNKQVKGRHISILC